MALILARVLVNECGWEPTDDGPAIHHVLTQRAQRMGVSYEQAARRYSRTTFEANLLPANRRWVAFVDSDSAPLSWPGNLDWSKTYAPRWRRILRFATQIVEGKEAPLCRPDHWGAAGGWNFERSLRLGWIEVDCGNTVNAFWRLPRNGEI